MYILWKKKQISKDKSKIKHIYIYISDLTSNDTKNDEISTTTTTNAHC